MSPTSNRIKALTEALRDCVSTFSNEHTVVTGDRKEMWDAVLREHGYRDGEPDVQAELAIKLGRQMLPHHIEAEYLTVRRAALREVSATISAIEHGSLAGADEHACAAHKILAAASIRDGTIIDAPATCGTCGSRYEPPTTGMVWSVCHCGGMLTTIGRPATPLHTDNREWPNTDGAFDQKPQ